MPKYTYKCTECESVFEQSHSMSITLEDCHMCGAQDSLFRLPSNFIVKQKQEAGRIVKNFIE